MALIAVVTVMGGGGIWGVLASHYCLIFGDSTTVILFHYGSLLNQHQAAEAHKIANGTPPVFDVYLKTSQELRMLSSVTLNCQVTKIVMDSGSQL